jgi:monothiol glutaredoxin
MVRRPAGRSHSGVQRLRRQRDPRGRGASRHRRSVAAAAVSSSRAKNPCKMPPFAFFFFEAAMSDVQQWIKETVTNTPVVLFMKGTAQFPQCGFSGRAIQILKACGVENIATVNVLEDPEVRQGIKEYSNWPTIPQLYVRGEFVGGSDIMSEMYESGELKALLQQTNG